jgi:hypothetical protein
MRKPVIFCRDLAVALKVLARRNQKERQPLSAFLWIVEKFPFCPEEMSDAENQFVWTRLIRFFRQYGITVSDFERELGVCPLVLQQWENGVNTLGRASIKQDLLRNMHDLLAVQAG